MGRSPGFASAPADSRPVQTRFRCASAPEGLRLAGGGQLVGSLCKRHAVTPKNRGSYRLQAHGFRFFSLRSLRSFSPFPHGTCALSVSQQYLALPDGAGRFGQDFSGPALLRVPAGGRSVRVRDCHPLRSRFPNVFHLGTHTLCRPYNPGTHAHRFGLFRFRSPLLAESLVCFLFLRVLRCFSSPGRSPCLRHGCHAFSGGGLPHSDTCGSKVVCTSPQLFAAYRVLRHLWEPRHPPCALACFLSFCGARTKRAPHGAIPCYLLLALALPVLSMNSSRTGATKGARARRTARGRTVQRAPGGPCPPFAGKMVEDKGFEPLTPSLQS